VQRSVGFRTRTRHTYCCSCCTRLPLPRSHVFTSTHTPTTSNSTKAVRSASPLHRWHLLLDVGKSPEVERWQDAVHMVGTLASRVSGRRHLVQSLRHRHGWVTWVSRWPGRGYIIVCWSKFDTYFYLLTKWRKHRPRAILQQRVWTERFRDSAITEVHYTGAYELSAIKFAVLKHSLLNVTWLWNPVRGQSRLLEASRLWWGQEQ